MAQRQPNFPLKIAVPGSFGVTGESSISGEVPEWLLAADNAIFNREGLIAPRALFRKIPDTSLTTPLSIDLTDTIQFIQSYPYVFVWNETDDELWAMYTDPIELTALGDNGTAPPASPTHGPMMVAALQGKYYFCNASTTMTVWEPGTPGTYSGVASPNSHGGVRNIDVLHSAFGRLWGALSDSKVLYWSVLLDGEDWSGTGSGSLDLSSYLTAEEYITAIADFNKYLVVFTSRTILIFQDPFTVPVDSSGDPGTETTMSLKEQINGVGCVGKNAWASVGEEVYFVDTSGLRRISRVLEEGGSNPIDPVCAHITPLLRILESSNNISTVNLNYLPTIRALAMDLHGQITYVIWLDRPIGEGSFAVTHWGSYGTDLTTDTVTGPPHKYITNPVQFKFFGTSYPVILCHYREYDELNQPVYNNLAYMPLKNYIMDDDTVELAETKYTFKIRSAWLNFGNGQDAVTKIMKDLKLIYRTPSAPYASGSSYVSTALDVSYRLRFDYDINPITHTFTTPLKERGVMLSPYHIMGAHTVTPLPLSGNGSYIQWEIEATIDNKAHEYFAIQQAGFSVKLGRIHQGI
jgi:hypothetical protein